MIGENADNIDKKYYSISEVAQILEVNPSLIRFWEAEFDIIQPTKNGRGERRFTKNDIENVKIVYHLVKEKGYTLEGAREYLKANTDLIREKMHTIQRLNSIKKFLENLRDGLTDS